MGEKIPDRCIFCKCDLEIEGYGGFESNGERASEDWEIGLDICKGCLKKLKL